MRDMSRPCVDPGLEEIYMNILIEKLETPEEWRRERNDTCYMSTVISGTKTYFKTYGDDRDGDYKTDKVSIRDGEYDEIYVLPINTRRVRRLIRKLNEYMKLKAEWAQYEEIDKKLKKGLPNNIDRYLKLSKIKKKL